MKTITLLAVVFLMPSCSTDPVSGKRLLFGKSTGEIISFGIGFGKEAAPIAEKHWKATTSTK